jgi:hypothetical protein
MLHLSADLGHRFVTVPHQLGLLRCIELLPKSVTLLDKRVRHPSLHEALTAVGLPPLLTSDAMQDHAPPSSSESMNGVNEPSKPPTALSSKSSAALPAASSKQFTYALSSTISLTQDEGAGAVIDELFRVGGLRAPGNRSLTSSAVRHGPPGDAYTEMIKRMERDPSLQLAYLRCAVLGTDGRVVPYDFTATLHLLIRTTPSDDGGVSLLCHTTASQVDYLPFVQSLASDAVGLSCFDVRSGDAVGVDGDDSTASNVVFVRSTSGGVSVSHDLGTSWSAPTRAFTGNVRRLDEGSFVVASSRSSIVRSDDAGKSCSTIAIPAQLRVPVVTDLDVMR